ncbi:hypothetical protein ACVIHI_001870 [Bradyrhizobium sp. USDA 4524]|nr:hypothetical protein [Bradyrhizobium sp. USDA 4538]MCP1905774.1 hypothetical protein [Bradyrhizobium sp. USDA 4537]MCP1988570.1 hypothetical protein [Bradyrhizobium sp. USDA 4539]
MQDRRCSFRSLSDSRGDFFPGRNDRRMVALWGVRPPIAAEAQPMRLDIPTACLRRVGSRVSSRSEGAQHDISTRLLGTSVRGRSRLLCSRPMPPKPTGRKPQLGWRPWCSVRFRALGPFLAGLENRATQAHISQMATIVQCNCGAEYRRTEEKFLVPHTGDAICTVCGAALESWLEATHVPTYELIERPDRKQPGGMTGHP